MELVIRALSKQYPHKLAVDRVSLTLTPGIYGLLGANGAGKTTLMRMLCGILHPTGGEISLDGLGVAQEEYRACLGYLPQDFGYYPGFTGEEFLWYMGALKGLRSGRESIRAVIEAVHLGEKRRARIRTLSGGQRQRVGIAQALLGDPAFLIFDEPTVGLDPEERIHFRNLFSRLAQDRLVLLSTHIIEDVQSVCSRLLVLHQGRLRFDGTPEELIRAAEGHVGTFEARAGGREDGLHITARVNTARGVACRAVAETLPPYVRPAEPTLEDAYLYLISGEGEA